MKKIFKVIKNIHLKRDSLIYLLKDFDRYGCESKGARPQPCGATVPWPLGAIALCLLKAKRQRAGCLSSGPCRGFLGASHVCTHGEEPASPSSHSGSEGDAQSQRRHTHHPALSRDMRVH